MTSLASLPNELLSHILFLGFSSEFDLPYLWCTIRNINQQFRHLVEDLVTRLQLKNTYITYTLTNPDSEARIEHPQVKFWLAFDGYAASQPDKAVFRSDTVINANPLDETWLALVLQKVEDAKMDEYLRPAHMLSCYHYVNDTELCGFEVIVIDSTRGLWEVRLDWKATLSRLLTEESLRQVLSREFVKEQRSRRVELDEKEIYGAHRAMRLHLLSHRRTRDDSSQQARQKRIAMQYALDGLDFDSVVRGNRDKMLLMRQKAEELEDHQSAINPFRFE